MPTWNTGCVGWVLQTAMRRPNLHTASWSTQYRAAFPSRFGQPRAPSWPSGGGGGGSRPPAARYAPTQSAPSAFHRPFERPTGFAAPAARHAAPAAVRHAASTWVPAAAPKPPLLTTPVPPSPIPPSPTPRTPTTPTTQNGGPPSRRNSPFIGKTRGFQNAVKQVVRSVSGAPWWTVATSPSLVSATSRARVFAGSVFALPLKMYYALE